MDFIVIIEDEDDMRELLEFQLINAGYDVEGFVSTQHVEDLLYEESVDLMIVDRNLPDMEGSDFIKKLRKQDIHIPVIFVSAKDSDFNIEEGFNKGGDDYITKPFEIKILLARVKAILKRTKHSNQNILEFRDIKLHKNSHRAFFDNAEIELTRLEFNLLVELINNRNIILSRDDLLQSVWGSDNFNQKTVNVAIQRLKQKIDPSGNKDYIKAIRGSGYIVLD